MKAKTIFFDTSGRELPGWHTLMIKDYPRSRAYDRALERIITENTKVLKKGAHSELLAMLAVKSEANKVRMPVMSYQMNVTI